MRVYKGDGTVEFGPGVQIDLTGEELALAIESWLVAHGVHIRGIRTIRANGQLCEDAGIYVDPSAYVVHHGMRYNGDGTDREMSAVFCDDDSKNIANASKYKGDISDHLILSIRAKNCLRMADIDTVSKLIQYHEIDLLRIRFLGKKTVNEINDVLKTKGLHLARRRKVL